MYAKAHIEYTKEVKRQEISIGRKKRTGSAAVYGMYGCEEP